MLLPHRARGGDLASLSADRDYETVRNFLYRFASVCGQVTLCTTPQQGLAVVSDNMRLYLPSLHPSTHCIHGELVHRIFSMIQGAP